MRTIFVAFFLVVIVVLAVPKAEAIPLFARKYNTTCFTCHTTPPLLNDFGRRFQANGYQLPGTNERAAQADQMNFAMGVLAQPMVSHEQKRNNIDTTLSSKTSFSGIEVALFSSASLGAHLSYYTEVPIAVEGGVGTIAIETANLMYTDVLSDGTGSLNFRLGKFFFFLPFIHTTILASADPIVFGYNPFEDKAPKPANDLTFAEGTYGTSAFGMIPFAEGLRWEAGLTGGTASDVDLGTAKAVFLALNQTVYVNNAPVRFGGFYYGGSEDIDTGSVPAAWTNHLSRVGVDAEFYDPWTKRLDFFGQYIVAKDDNVDSVGGGYNMTGGFAGLNVIVLPEKLYVYGRYDFQKIKETGNVKHQIDLGVQFHLLPNVLLLGVCTIGTEIEPNVDDPSINVTDKTTTTIGAGVRFGF